MVSVYVVVAPPATDPTWAYGPPDVVPLRTEYPAVAEVAEAVQESATL